MREPFLVMPDANDVLTGVLFVLSMAVLIFLLWWVCS